MKPFINYIGSKKFLIKKIKLPENINNYYEPFIGGGSIFFHINNKCNIKKNYINDLNKDLITTYKVIKNNENKNELLKNLKNLSKFHSKDDFKNKVDTFNKIKNKILKSALFIYLSKRSFNSLLSYKKNNQLSPSYSKRESSKKIYDEENINNISKLLKKTIIKNQDYKLFLQKTNPKKGDFVFLDPPYLVKKINNYYQDTFDKNDFEELKIICDKLNKNQVNFMVTLNYNKVFKDLFKNYNIKIINKYSFVSSNKKSRNSEKEMVITNY